MSTTVLQPRTKGQNPSGSIMAVAIAGLALALVVGYGLDRGEVSSADGVATQSANTVVHDRWSRMAEQAQIERAKAAAIADFRALQYVGPRTSEYFGNYSDLVNGQPALTFGTLRTDSIWSNQADVVNGSPAAANEPQDQDQGKPKSITFHE